MDAATRAALEADIAAGSLMRCLNEECGQVFDKLQGCNWVQCWWCKAEHCWQTKKLRHGPNGCGGGHACH